MNGSCDGSSLLADHASFVTGQALAVGGGVVAQ
ncbi:hypothetical protein BJ998_007160 [Kutzneria kofuensis]|uniref:Uncharacterized protein n=1 Tax=Kutzneria kofuensis TaxID=103725 RepID=A0A7W9KNT0_9PSEU|nr:hypothetical protein [Kutzneria kofuensis]